MYDHSQVQIPPVSALSVIARSWALKYSPASNLASVSSQNFALHFATALHLALVFFSCNCCHYPFIVRSAQTRPPFTGFTQLAHPSRCSRSTLTTVCFCARASPRVSVFTSGLQSRHQIHHRLVTFILWWSVGSTVSRIPILQTCNVVVILKQKLASFQHLRSFSP